MLNCCSEHLLFKEFTQTVTHYNWSPGKISLRKTCHTVTHQPRSSEAPRIKPASAPSHFKYTPGEGPAVYVFLSDAHVADGGQAEGCRGHRRASHWQAALMGRWMLGAGHSLSPLGRCFGLTKAVCQWSPLSSWWLFVSWETQLLNVRCYIKLMFNPQNIKLVKKLIFFFASSLLKAAIVSQSPMVISAANK